MSWIYISFRCIAKLLLFAALFTLSDQSYWISMAAAEEGVSLSEIQKIYKDATVFVAVEFETADGKGCEVGTGFLISSSGYVLTSRHLITDDKGELYKRYSIAGSVREPFRCDRPRGVVKDLNYVRSEPDQDVMLLKFSSDETYNYVKACQQTVVESGEDLYVLGFPLGDPLVSTRVTRGHTSGPRGRWQIGGAINEGNSGGPIFNKYARLVGMVYGDYDKAKNYAFMVPFDHFKGLFGYASAAIETCETASGGFAKGSCLYMQKNQPIDFVMSEHTGVSSSSKDYAQSISADLGYVIGSWEWRPSSANNASGVELNVSDDRRSLRISTTLRSGPIFDRWRGWLIGTVVLNQVPESCPRTGVGIK